MRQRLALLGLAAAATGYAVRRARRYPLRDRVALITGGSRGLGLLLARELGVRGCRVAVCARNGDELRRAVTDLRALGITAHGITCDLRDRDQIRAMVAETADYFDGLDIVVNNAGIIHSAPLDALGETEFDDAMRIMFWAPLWVFQEARPHLKGGVLVNITSVGGKISPPHLLPYACAKFAHVGLSEGLDAELVRDNIRVLTVVPGLMRTGSTRRANYAGNAALEYAWFSLLAGTPLVSMSAARAARRIVDAIEDGRHHLTLTPLARVATAAHGIAPGLTQGVLRTVNRILPGPGTEGPTVGFEAASRADQWGMRFLTWFNDRAGRDLNQMPEAGRAPVPKPRTRRRTLRRRTRR